MKLALSLLTLLVCSPCASGFGPRCFPVPVTTLREVAIDSKFVAVGRPENVREAPTGHTTDIRLTKLIKGHPAVSVETVIRVPSLVTIPDPKNPPQLLVFGDIENGKPDVHRGVPLTPALLAYFNGSLAIDLKDQVKLLRFAFDYLEHKEAAIAEDAFNTFDKATAPDIREAGRLLSAEKLRRCLQTEATRRDRVRLYAFLLASCGDEADAILLRKCLDKWVKEEPSGLLDGVLTAYTILDPKAGWGYTRDLCKMQDTPFNIRYAGLSSARYFHNTHPGVLTRQEISEVMGLLLKQDDMADIPIEDLRKWKDWSFTEEILGLYHKKGFDEPIVRRAVIKYALCCPDQRAAKLIAELRTTEPKRVAFLEEALKEERRDDVLVADFEGDTYPEGWKTTGTAFGKGPAKGTLPNQMAVTGYLGKGLVNSFHGGDDSTGTLTSPAFKIERKYLNFLVGGGKHPGKTCVNLLVGGKVVRTATGPNDKPGGSEQLDWHSWDVAEFEGKEVVIEIVDDEKGGWGHINTDQFVQSDKKKQAELQAKEFAFGKQYLHLPVKTGAPMRRVTLSVRRETPQARVSFRDTVVHEFDIELADGVEPDYWAFLDVSRHRDPLRGEKNRSLVVKAMLPADSKALAALKMSDDLPAAEKLYREKHRPLFHFTSRFGWLNDPNGLVYHDKEWHLFYQHNPFGVNWGNMHWGHAVSRDLVRWKEEGIALYPKQYGDWAFSGSAVVDNGNTSGWGAKEKPPLVLAYTSTGRGECIAFSTDNGRTWKEYNENPVVKHIGRDPKLVWYEKGKHWVMAVYDEFEKKQWIAFYTSPDLKTWTFASRIEGFYECPDLFELRNRLGSGQEWVLYAADGKYLVGKFDGKEFKPDFKEKKQLWYGRFYAAQTFDNTPLIPVNNGTTATELRRVQIGWAQGVTFPGMPFNQQMNVPVGLTLWGWETGSELSAYPVEELESLREPKPAFEVREAKPLAVKERVTLADELDAFDIQLLIERPKTAGFTLDLRGTKLTYNAAKGELICKDVTAPIKDFAHLRVLVDRGSIEVFAGPSQRIGGSVAMSVAATPDEKNHKVELIPHGGEITIKNGGIWRMKSAWEK